MQPYTQSQKHVMNTVAMLNILVHKYLGLVPTSPAQANPHLQPTQPELLG